MEEPKSEQSIPYREGIRGIVQDDGTIDEDSRALRKARAAKEREARQRAEEDQRRAEEAGIQHEAMSKKLLDKLEETGRPVIERLQQHYHGVADNETEMEWFDKGDEPSHITELAKREAEEGRKIKQALKEIEEA